MSKLNSRSFLNSPSGLIVMLCLTAREPFDQHCVSVNGIDILGQYDVDISP